MYEQGRLLASCACTLSKNRTRSTGHRWEANKQPTWLIPCDLECNKMSKQAVRKAAAFACQLTCPSSPIRLPRSISVSMVRGMPLDDGPSRQTHQTNDSRQHTAAQSIMKHPNPSKESGRLHHLRAGCVRWLPLKAKADVTSDRNSAGRLLDLHRLSEDTAHIALLPCHPSGAQKVVTPLQVS